LILFEDIDSIGAQDRGGSGAIGAVINSAKQPVILTATDQYDKKVTQLRYSCIIVELRRPTASMVAKALTRIDEQEKLGMAPDEIEAIAKNALGDLRAAISDLQARNVFAGRDREKGIFETVRGIFKAKSFADAKASMIQAADEHDDIKSWVGWNIPYEFDSEEKPADYKKCLEMNNAFDMLSRADMFDGRIMKRQYWALLKYSNDLIGPGVASAKQTPVFRFVKYERPPFSYKFSLQYGTMKNISRKIAKVAHCNIKDSAWFIPIIVSQFRQFPNKVKDLYGFDKEEIAKICGMTESSVEKLLEKDYETRAKEPEEKAEEKIAKPEKAEAKAEVKTQPEKQKAKKEKPEKTEEAKGQKEAQMPDSEKHAGEEEKTEKKHNAPEAQKEKPKPKNHSLSEYM